MSLEEFNFAYKPRLMGPAYEFVLSKDTLDWATATGSGRVSYPMIRRIRLGYKPTNMASSRFIAEIWPANAPKIALHSVSARNIIDVTDLGSEYARFLRELHRRLAATGSNCICEAGFPAWRWWPSAIVAVLTLLAIVYIVLHGLFSGQFLIAGIVGGTGAWFLWQIWNIIMRNRPRRYHPDAIPEDVLPKS